MSEIARESDTCKGKVRLYENGIMHQTYHEGACLTKEDSAAEILLYKEEYCKDLKRPILIDITGLKSVSKESRGIYSSKETAEYLSSAALLIGNPVTRIIGNFYLGLNKAYMPIKLFTSEEDAFAWLEGFLKK